MIFVLFGTSDGRLQSSVGTTTGPVGDGMLRVQGPDIVREAVMSVGKGGGVRGNGGGLAI